LRFDDVKGVRFWALIVYAVAIEGYLVFNLTTQIYFNLVNHDEWAMLCEIMPNLIPAVQFLMLQAYATPAFFGRLCESLRSLSLAYPQEVRHMLTRHTILCAAFSSISHAVFAMPSITLWVGPKADPMRFKNFVKFIWDAGFLFDIYKWFVPNFHILLFRIVCSCYGLQVKWMLQRHFSCRLPGQDSGPIQVDSGSFMREYSSMLQRYRLMSHGMLLVFLVATLMNTSLICVALFEMCAGTGHLCGAQWGPSGSMLSAITWHYYTELFGFFLQWFLMALSIADLKYTVTRASCQLNEKDFQCSTARIAVLGYFDRCQHPFQALAAIDYSNLFKVLYVLLTICVFLVKRLDGGGDPEPFRLLEAGG